MRVALDMALFLASVYNYIWPKNKNGIDDDEPQPDIANHDIEDDGGQNDAYKGYQKFNSDYVVTQKNHPFFDYREQEDQDNDNQIYTRLAANEELEKWQKEKELSQMTGISGFATRFWNGTKTIMNNYVKAKQDLNKETLKSSETLQNVQDYIATTTESIHMRVTKYMFARKAMREMNKHLTSDFVTL